MLRVGLTGGVGSGKSRVADMLAELGAHVSRSDEIGRALMQPGQRVMAAIVDYFGASVLTQAGTLDRAELAQIAFSEGRVEELNALVHPAVIAEQSRWLDAIAAEEPGAVAVVESALIFETRHTPAEPSQADPQEAAAPWRTRFDRIVVVTAPEALRRQRYIARVSGAGVDAEQAAADFNRRMRVQWSQERKAAWADVVLENDGSMEDLRKKVENLYAGLKQEAIDGSSGAM